MKLITIYLDNPHASDVRDQPVSTGIPLPQAAVGSQDELRLTTRYGRPLEHHAQVLGHWPDGSLRWVMVSFSASVAAGETLAVDVARAPGSDSAGDAATAPAADAVAASGTAADPAAAASGQQSPGRQAAKAGGFAVRDQADRILALPDAIGGRGQPVVDAALELTDARGQRIRLTVLDPCQDGWQSGQTATRVTRGRFALAEQGDELQVTLRQTIQSGGSLSRLDIELHNPAAAVHPGGIWDLGDPGSIHFQAVELVLHLAPGAAVHWRLHNADEWQVRTGDSLSILQAGSGGKHWKSPVHLDRDGRITPAFRGYQVQADGALLGSGDRCEPALQIRSDTACMSVRPTRFWQQFPKALQVQADRCSVALLPAVEGLLHELQGGESTTTVIYISHAEPLDTTAFSALDWVSQPLALSLECDAVFRSQALPDWHEQARDPRYTALLDKGLRGAQSFFAKREQVDEYGWRHFGELYADHETWNQPTDGIFVSHYNNQYDPVYGFGRQFLQTGDVRWFELMNDLALHVLDIDLYRTDADRPEYNQGLFWHTDHYLPAATATHRTYSRLQQTGSGGPAGGGPGGQHCYTSGLRLYYQLTGNSRARQAVFDLAGWIGIVYDGSGSLLEQARRTLAQDLPALLKVLRGQTVLRYRYPLDRGIGNYIRALLDCFALDGDPQHLGRAGAIIRDTAGPEDDIDERDLGAVEVTWFYTVFLQAVVDFLDAKRTSGALDADYHYARALLLHYAQWMCRHEAPYLDTPEKLEFPNDTWVAQDARKASVLHAAYRYAHDDRDPLLAGARRLRDYVIDTLEASDTAFYTRIQAILLQNDGPLGNRWTSRPPHDYDPAQAPASQPVHATAGSLLAALSAAWWRCLRGFSLQRERAWLAHRLPGVTATGRGR